MMVFYGPGDAMSWPPPTRVQQHCQPRSHLSLPDTTTGERESCASLRFTFCSDVPTGAERGFPGVEDQYNERFSISSE